MTETAIIHKETLNVSREAFRAWVFLMIIPNLAKLLVFVVEDC